MRKLFLIYAFIFFNQSVLACTEDEFVCYSVWNVAEQRLEQLCEIRVCNPALPDEPFPDNPPGEGGEDPPVVPGGDIIHNVQERCLRQQHEPELKFFEMSSPNNTGRIFNPTKGQWGNKFKGIVDMKDNPFLHLLQNIRFDITYTKKPGYMDRLLSVEPKIGFEFDTLTNDERGQFGLQVVGTGSCQGETAHLAGPSIYFNMEGVKPIYEMELINTVKETHKGIMTDELIGCPAYSFTQTFSYREEFSISQNVSVSAATLVTLSMELNFTISSTITKGYSFTKPEGRELQIWEYPKYEEYSVYTKAYDWSGTPLPRVLNNILKKSYRVFEPIDSGLCTQ